MAGYRTLILKHHIYAIVPVVAEDGEKYTHLVIEDTNGGQDLINKLSSAGLLIFDSKVDDPKNLDEKYKRHTFTQAEWEGGLRQVLVVVEPE